MKRMIALLSLLLCLTLGAVQAEVEYTIEDGHVTGYYESHPVPDWVPEYVEAFTVDMPEPTPFPAFSIARVQQYEPPTKQIRAAVAPYTQDTEDVTYRIEIKETYLNLLNIRGSTFAPWIPSLYAPHGYTGHPKQEAIDQAVSVVRNVLDDMGISYEFPFLTVLRVEDYVSAERHRLRNYESPEYDQYCMIRDNQQDAEEYIMDMLGLDSLDATIINARFSFGGLPCVQDELVDGKIADRVTNTPPSGGGYKGGGGVLRFLVRDDGQIHGANIHYAHTALRETPFEGETISWQEAIEAFIAGNEILSSTGLLNKGWWMEHREYVLQDPNPNYYYIVGMEAGCTYMHGKTRPMWVIYTVDPENPLMTRAYHLIDAETGEMYR